jgi:hypothetical protein
MQRTTSHMLGCYEASAAQGECIRLPTLTYAMRTPLHPSSHPLTHLICVWSIGSLISSRHGRMGPRWRTRTRISLKQEGSRQQAGRVPIDELELTRAAGSDMET